MANVLTKNPIVIDTAAGTVLFTDDLFITAIRWEAGTSGAAGDQAVVQDQSGNVFFSDNATGANYSKDFTPSDGLMKGRRISGLKVPTLAHGILYIYLA